MSRQIRLLACVAILAVLLPAAWALAPQEVLVVGNANSSDSVELAKFYARKRGIPPCNVVLLATTTGHYISRDDYDRQIRLPLAQRLDQADTPLRCIVLVWGMPLHVNSPPDPYRESLNKLYRDTATKAHSRLAIGYELLATVGRDFPAPKADDLEVASVFPGPPPVLPQKLKNFARLRRDVEGLLKVKRQLLDGITDPRRRAIAVRQMMALELNLRGLSGLIAFIEDVKPADAPPLAALKGQLQEAKERRLAIRKDRPTVEEARSELDLIDRIGGAIALGAHANQQAQKTKAPPSDAAVDSELALLRWDAYPLPQWRSNPLHWRRPFPDKVDTQPSELVVMTSRIDGPTPQDARRIIEDSIAAERAGLRGTFYIDAAGPGGQSGKSLYDAKLINLHRLAKAHTSLEGVVLDRSKAVFPPGACPDAALYVGWYSLQRYVPAFTWVRGAVGWHIASLEARHLHDPTSREWCVKMIQNGIAATVGAVAEPYLMAFPMPDEFFPLLLTGKYTIAECYWRTVPAVSWRMMLIADPLYNPFSANPQVSVGDLPPTLLPPR